jgi:hypothetical protein
MYQTTKYKGNLLRIAWSNTTSRNLQNSVEVLRNMRGRLASVVTFVGCLSWLENEHYSFRKNVN